MIKSETLGCLRRMCQNWWRNWRACKTERKMLRLMIKLDTIQTLQCENCADYRTMDRPKTVPLQNAQSSLNSYSWLSFCFDMTQCSCFRLKFKTTSSCILRGILIPWHYKMSAAYVTIYRSVGVHWCFEINRNWSEQRTNILSRST